MSTSTTGLQMTRYASAREATMAAAMRVLLFAAAREAVGQPFVDVDVSDVVGEVTVAVVRSQLSLQWPSLQRVLSQSRIAIDHRFAADSDVVIGREVAVIPPVAGG